MGYSCTFQDNSDMLLPAVIHKCLCVFCSQCWSIANSLLSLDLQKQSLKMGLGTSDFVIRSKTNAHIQGNKPVLFFFAVIYSKPRHSHIYIRTSYGKTHLRLPDARVLRVAPSASTGSIIQFWLSNSFFFPAVKWKLSSSQSASQLLSVCYSPAACHQSNCLSVN